MITDGYEVGCRKAFRASHRLPVPGPEGELHEHDYLVELVVRRRTVDASGMVVDLDVLRAVLGDVVGSVEGRDLDLIRPDDVDAVTVEVLARWMTEQMAERLAEAGVESVTVRVWESDAEFGGFTAILDGAS